MPNPGDIRVFHHPQIPCKPFEVDVDSVKDAVKLANTLAEYDYFQYENNIKPDYCNVTHICRWEEWDGEWDWESIDDEELEENGLLY